MSSSISGSGRSRDVFPGEESTQSREDEDKSFKTRAVALDAVGYMVELTRQSSNEDEGPSTSAEARRCIELVRMRSLELLGESSESSEESPAQSGSSQRITELLSKLMSEGRSSGDEKVSGSLKRKRPAKRPLSMHENHYLWLEKMGRSHNNSTSGLLQLKYSLESRALLEKFLIARILKAFDIFNPRRTGWDPSVISRTRENISTSCVALARRILAALVDEALEQHKLNMQLLPREHQSLLASQRTVCFVIPFIQHDGSFVHQVLQEGVAIGIEIDAAKLSAFLANAIEQTLIKSLDRGYIFGVRLEKNKSTGKFMLRLLF